MGNRLYGKALTRPMFAQLFTGGAGDRTLPFRESASIPGMCHDISMAERHSPAQSDCRLFNTVSMASTRTYILKEGTQHDTYSS